MRTWCWYCSDEIPDARFNQRICRACRPIERELWIRTESLAGQRVTATMRTLYGQTGRYAYDLAVLCKGIGYQVHHNQYRHRFPKGQTPQIPGASWDFGLSWSGPAEIDHPVLLRRLDATGFALLSQPYRETGGGLDLGPAPYGHGTYAELWESPPARAAREAAQRAGRRTT